MEITYHSCMKTTLKEATLTLNSRFDGVWLQVETADGTVQGRIVFSGCRRVSVSLPGMVEEVSLMRWLFS